ncbi:CRISPR-associated endonuclease Cas2 [Sulfobacillus thermosulfidooxidans]|uniref:CRISPR-associated endonuclease Cas2 n=1 Tax=Sulfobacillus thermosulfidooxidans TaxID=28034 RepID=UPI00041482CC|nr:CRISPR-associated endonuclease Cas2 [Sulfobacillus thermosulfidooxidans]
MFVILVYDAGVKRDPKILKTCRKYLNWTQNSVFEGELTEGKLKKLQRELGDIINAKEDYIVIYVLANQRYNSRIRLGKPKGEEGFIL